MPITSISRDWGIDPQIVRIVTTDTLQTIIAPGYFATQEDQIEALQHGDFEWRDTDYVLIVYGLITGGVKTGFFIYNINTDAFEEQGVVPAGFVATSAQILTMNAAPLQLLAALPITMAYILNRIWCTYNFVTTQYAAGGAISLRWGPTANLASSTLAAATFNGYAADNAFDLTPDGTDTIANIAGMGIFLSNDTGAFTTGDGILTVNLNYNIVTI